MFPVGFAILYPTRSKGGGMEQLIEAALANAKALRNGAKAADRHGVQSAEEEAERGNGLATVARAELARRSP